MKKRRKVQSEDNSHTLSNNLVAVHLGGCLSPEQIAASVTGELNQIDQDTVMAHLAACTDCSAQYNLLLGPKAQQPTLFSHGRWRWWLLAAGILVAAPLLLLSGKGTEVPPAKPVAAAPVIKPEPAAIIAPQPAAAPAVPVTPLTSPAAKPSTPAPVATRIATVTTKPAAVATKPVPSATAKLPQPPAEPKKNATLPPAPNSKLLMTAAEAALPASTQAGLAGISVDDGPTIVIDQPQDGATVGSGFALHILYEASGRETIDLSTVKLVCRKQPPINLTPRIKSHITPKGIWLDNVQLPPGKYRLRLTLADTMGRPAEREFSLTVVP